MSNPIYAAGGGHRYGLGGHPEPANVADVLERVLDRGIVIAGDIKVNLLDIELLTIKLRLLIASVDRAREMGINWWESDPSLSMGQLNGDGGLARRVEQLESRLGMADGGEAATAERPEELRRPSERSERPGQQRPRKRQGPPERQRGD